MPPALPGALLAALLGAAIAYANYRLTDRAARNPNERFAGISIVRQALNFGYLAAVFFLAPYTPFDRTWCLVGAVVGLTLPTFFFTFRILRRLSHPAPSDKPDHSEGGES